MPPVLLLVFNRPDTTAQVFAAIRAARPERLYVAADGARSNRSGEAERCAQTRELATRVDWPCEVRTLFRESNLGCKRAVSSAISWFFEHEEMGVILEDDCLPDPSFFPYCAHLLERYRHEPRVMCISGDNFVEAAWAPQSSYYYSRLVHIWGWATWRRAWQHYQVDLPARDRQRAAVLKKVFPSDPLSRRFWADCLDRVSRGEIDTWDYQWTYACWKAGGMTCLPAHNLISNIGFGPGATHTTDPSSALAGKPTRPLVEPLVPPNSLAPADVPDAWSASHLFPLRDYRLSKVWKRRFRDWLGRHG